MTRINEQEFIEKYKPIKNPMCENAAYDGALYETYGAELDYVRKIAQEKPDNVWTVLDSDGFLTIGSGFHFVNRIGYIITENPAQGDVEVYDPEDLAEYEAQCAAEELQEEGTEESTAHEDGEDNAPRP